MDTTKIRQIIELFESSALAKMELEIEDMKISMEKPGSEVQYISAPSVEIANNKVDENATVQSDCACGEAIVSPLVGTYYAASGEGSEPFVRVGSKVQKGDVLCIIEAMKAMNEIRADKDGVITTIKATNGNLVQFDEILMYIE